MRDVATAAAPATPDGAPAESAGDAPPPAPPVLAAERAVQPEASGKGEWRHSLRELLRSVSGGPMTPRSAPSAGSRGARRRAGRHRRPCGASLAAKIGTGPPQGPSWATRPPGAAPRPGRCRAAPIVRGLHDRRCKCKIGAAIRQHRSFKRPDSPYPLSGWKFRRVCTFRKLMRSVLSPTSVQLGGV